MSRTIIVDPGLDHTVLTVVKDGTTARSEIPWESTEATASHVADLLDSDPGANAVVDVTGAGAAVYDKLRELGMNVQPFYPGRRSHGIRYAIDEMKINLKLAAQVLGKTPEDLILEEAQHLEGIRRGLLDLVCRPGFLVSDGKVVVNEATGEPYLDMQVRREAFALLLKVSQEKIRFLGLAMPSRRVSDLAGIPLADIEQHMKDLRAGLGLPVDGSGDLPDGKAPPVPEDGGE